MLDLRVIALLQFSNLKIHWDTLVLRWFLVCNIDPTLMLQDAGYVTVWSIGVIAIAEEMPLEDGSVEFGQVNFVDADFDHFGMVISKIW